MVEPRATILSLDRDACVACWGNTLIQVWIKLTDEDVMKRTSDVARNFAAGQNGQITLLSIIERKSVVPTDGARKVRGQFFEDTSEKIVCMAIVPEGGELRSSIVRSVGVSEGLPVYRFPMKFVANTDAAIDVLAPYLTAASGGADGLRAAVTNLRAQIREQLAG